MVNNTRVYRYIVFAVCLCLLGVASTTASASNVRLSGIATYTYVGNTAVLTADRVDNLDSSGYSGTLKLELWALPAPYAGSFTVGYKVAEYQLGQLFAQHFYFNINSGAVLFLPPPNGVWAVALILTEYDGGPLDGGYSVRDFINFSNPLVVGSPPPPPVVFPTAIEYFNAGFGHYFVTALPDEISKLDAGVFPGWSRTGQSFSVYPLNTAGASNVCRFFSTSFAPRSSHFYTPFSDECATVQRNGNWQYEGLVFAVALPDAGGNCSPGTQPLYRLYNNGQGGAPNHRYTTSFGIRSNMVALGWVSEGYGAAGVISCVPAT
jgi:hypothetical protein